MNLGVDNPVFSLLQPSRYLFYVHFAYVLLSCLILTLDSVELTIFVRVRNFQNEKHIFPLCCAVLILKSSE